MSLSRLPMWKGIRISQVNFYINYGLRVQSSSSSLLRDLDSHKIEEDFVTIGSRKIKYLRSGCGPHAVLCCPGALGSAWTDFKHQILGLDRNELTVVVWDPPGYGLSRPPEKDLKPGFFIRDAHLAYSLMKALDLPIFSVLGWSAGALPAIGLGATYPKNINKLVVWGTLVRVSDYVVQQLDGLRNVDLWPEKVKAQYIELYGYDEFRTMWNEWVSTLTAYNRRYDRGDLCLNVLKQVSCPLLLLHGNKDSIVTVDHAKNIVELVPRAEFYSFTNGTHNIHQKFYKEFNSVVMNFLLKPHPNAVNKKLLVS